MSSQIPGPPPLQAAGAPGGEQKPPVASISSSPLSSTDAQPAESDMELEELWVMFLDDDGDPYYFNVTTQESVRERPVETATRRVLSEQDYAALVFQQQQQEAAGLGAQPMSVSSTTPTAATGNNNDLQKGGLASQQASVALGSDSTSQGNNSSPANASANGSNALGGQAGLGNNASANSVAIGAAAVRAQMQGQDGFADDWEEFLAEDGVTRYYYSPSRNESRWELPSTVNKHRGQAGLEKGFQQQQVEQQYQQLEERYQQTFRSLTETSVERDSLRLRVQELEAALRTRDAEILQLRTRAAEAENKLSAALKASVSAAAAAAAANKGNDKLIAHDKAAPSIIAAANRIAGWKQKDDDESARTGGDQQFGPGGEGSDESLGELYGSSSSKDGRKRGIPMLSSIGRAVAKAEGNEGSPASGSASSSSSSILSSSSGAGGGGGGGGPAGSSSLFSSPAAGNVSREASGGGGSPGGANSANGGASGAGGPGGGNRGSGSKEELKGLAAGIVSQTGITLSQLSFLKSVPLFHSFSEDKFLKLATKLRRVDFKEGAIILKQGDPPDGFFFIIEGGRVNIHVKPKDKQGQGAGGGGGLQGSAAAKSNRALKSRSITNGPADSPAGGNSADGAEGSSPNGPGGARSNRPSTLSGRGGGDDDDEDDDMQGDEDYDGEEEEQQQVRKSVQEEMGPVVAELSKGMFFGERALMTSEPRAASCIAGSGGCTCYALDRKGFEEVLSSMSDFLGEYSRQNYKKETPETIALARHVHSFRMLLEAVVNHGLSLETDFERDSQLPPARALVEMLSLFSPEITVNEIAGRLRRTLKGVIDCEHVEIILHDSVASELLIPSVLGNPVGGNAPGGGGGGMGDGKPADAALDPSMLDAARKACAYLGGRSSNDGYVRVPVVASGSMEYCVTKMEPVFSNDIRQDPRYTTTMPFALSAQQERARKEKGLKIGCWYEQQKAMDQLMGLPDRSRSLAVSPVVDGDGTVLAVLLVMNKLGGADPNAAAKALKDKEGSTSKPILKAITDGSEENDEEDDEDEDEDEKKDAVGSLPSSGTKSARNSAMSPAVGAGAGAGAGAAGRASVSSSSGAASGSGEEAPDTRNRRLTGLRTWTLDKEAAIMRHADESLAQALPPASGVDKPEMKPSKSARGSIFSLGSSSPKIGGPRASIASTGSFSSGGSGSGSGSDRGSSGSSGSPSSSSSSLALPPGSPGSTAAASAALAAAMTPPAALAAAAAAAERRATLYTDSPMGSFSERDEDIISGMSEALAMALDDRRVELETIISSRNFTPLVDITDFFRVQLNSVIHVPLPGSKAGSAVPNENNGAGGSGAGGGKKDGSGDGDAAASAAAKLKSSKSGRSLIVGGSDGSNNNRSASSDDGAMEGGAPKATGGMQLRAAKAAASDAEIPSVAVTAKQVGQVNVSVCLYHGSAPLAETRSENAALQAEKDRVAGAAMWNVNLSLGVRFCNLPLAARVIFNVTYKDGTPVGWAGCNVFTAQQVLRSGTLILPLWPGKLTPENILRITNLANTHAKTDSVPSLVVSLHSFGKTVVRLDTSSHIMLNRTKTSTALVDEDGNPSIDYLALKVTPAEYTPAMREKVASIIRADPLWRIQGDEAALLWKCREYITNAPEALPKFLQAVKWDDAPSVEEAHRLLLLWRPPSPMQALELLQADFADPTVRAYAVSRLEMLGDAELHTFMLQLTQVLKFEPFLDSSLARFLLRRALRRPRLIGHVLFWYLKAEMHIPEVAERFGAILQQYLVNCGDHRTELGHQMFVMAKLEDIARKVKAAEGKAERLALLRAELPRIVFPERFQLPLSPHMVSKGLIVDKCRVMSSKKLPLWLVFEAATEGGGPFSPGGGATIPKALAPKTVSVLFKAGDDLRQDQLTLQLLGVMDAFWKAEGLDMRMCPYRCVSTGDELGMIEVVLNSNTLANIVAESIEGGGSGLSRKFRAAMQVYSKDLVYREWLQSQEPAPDMNVVEDNFVRSCAGYCVATYVLGIGDRHNDNLMLTRDGKLFHIDFGHFLGNFKSKFGYKRERAPFVFTPAFAAVMGGEGAPAYKRFESLACASYNVLRRHGHLLITLFYLMMASGLPELTEVKDMAWLQDKLMLSASEDEAADHFRKQIKVSLNTRATLFNDAVHLFKHA